MPDLKDKIEKILQTTNDIDGRLKSLLEEYDQEYEQLKTAGLSLLSCRKQSVQLIESVQALVNSIAKTPKSFKTAFETIEASKQHFKDSQEYGKQQFADFSKSMVGAGVGAVGGIAVAKTSESVMMWVATTFGRTASHKAIRGLGGAAAKRAALAWLGRGAVAAGGGGMAAGTALIEFLSGPFGWGIAGVSLVASLLSAWKKSVKIKEEKAKQILILMDCISDTKRLRLKQNALKKKTYQVRLLVKKAYSQCCPYKSGNYLSFSEDTKNQLGALVNNTKSLSALLAESIKY